jgi:CheY-like chemotaxis protein
MTTQSQHEASDVLVVDDEKRIADTLVLILNSKGYTAHAAYDGVAAYQDCGHRAPRLVISDVVMPEMNGVDLAIRLRLEMPQVKVLLFSGQTATADMLENARKRGFHFDLLAKPVHPEQLLSKVRDIIGLP